MDPHVDLKYQPKNVFEKFSIGQVFKSVHACANKMISSATITENYKANISCLNEYYDLLKTTNRERPEKFELPSPITIRLNPHDIDDVYSAFYKVRFGKIEVIFKDIVQSNCYLLQMLTWFLYLLFAFFSNNLDISYQEWR